MLQGAFHSSDLWYVFKSLKNCWRPWTAGDWALSEQMLTAWSNFAKTGDPNTPGASRKSGGAGSLFGAAGPWTPCTAAKPDFMVFRLDDADAVASAMGTPLRPAPAPRR